jgi:hypothetical protein
MNGNLLCLVLELMRARIGDTLIIRFVGICETSTASMTVLMISSTITGSTGSTTLSEASGGCQGIIAACV